jgi:hypothetical protein
MTRRRTTDDFIRDLATLAPPPAFSPAVTVLTMGGIVALGVALLLAAIGVRSDLATAITEPMILAKSVLPVMLSATAMLFALQAARPGVTRPMLPLAVPVLLAGVLFAWQAVQTPADALLPGIVGNTAVYCLLSITSLSFLPVAAAIALFRRGATTRPVWTGGLIGLAASAAVASGYALHCTEDSPLFFTVWYGLGIAICGCAGAWAGHRFLRW